MLKKNVAIIWYLLIHRVLWWFFMGVFLIKIEAHGKGHAQVCRQFGLECGMITKDNQLWMIWSLQTHNIENGKCDKKLQTIMGYNITLFVNFCISHRKVEYHSWESSVHARTPSKLLADFIITKFTKWFKWWAVRRIARSQNLKHIS